MAYERIKCPSCDLTFGQESRFLDHLTNDHGVVDHLQLYIETFHRGVHKTCECSPDCQQKLSWAGWKRGFVSRYARGHNARIDSVYLNPERQAEFAAKRTEGFRTGKYEIWNAGLTKETSPVVARMSLKISESLSAGHSSGSIVGWQAKDPQKATEAAKKCSTTKKKMFASGSAVPWNLGLTKQNNAAVARAAHSISENYAKHPDASARRLSPDEFVNRVATSGRFELLSAATEYRNKYQKFRLKCVDCGTVQDKNLMMIEHTPVCFHCHPKESSGQLEVIEFIRSLGAEAVSNDRSVISPFEIDVLVPSAKLAIEYDGLYWHSIRNNPDKKYAEKKRAAVIAAGYRFFGIYEDEWRDKRAVVEGMIRHRLHMPTEVFNARSLTLELVSSKQAEPFFDASHLEGHVRCSAAYGLVSDGRLLAAMSLRRPFHASKATHLEVARSACLPGIVVRGWIGRLTSACLRYAKNEGYQGLMTYVDSRVGSGVGYENSAWKLSSASTGPRFWWTDFHSRFNRFKYRADSAAGLTQAEVAAAAGVVEIWGCGNRAYVAE